MKKLNQFINEYIVKKKLDHAINSETDSINIMNTIRGIFEIKDEKIVDEIISFINENNFNNAKYFMSKLDTDIYKKHISKTNETINNIINDLRSMPRDVLWNNENEQTICNNDYMWITTNTYKKCGLIIIDYYLDSTDVKLWVVLTK